MGESQYDGDYEVLVISFLSPAVILLEEAFLSVPISVQGVFLTFTITEKVSFQIKSILISFDLTDIQDQ